MYVNGTSENRENFPPLYTTNHLPGRSSVAWNVECGIALGSKPVFDNIPIIFLARISNVYNQKKTHGLSGRQPPKIRDGEWLVSCHLEWAILPIPLLW